MEEYLLFWRFVTVFLIIGNFGFVFGFPEILDWFLVLIFYKSCLRSGLSDYTKSIAAEYAW